MTPGIFEKLNRYFQEWEFGVLNEAGSSLFVKAGAERFLAFLRAKNAEGNHIFLRPKASVEPFFLLVDDLDWSQIEKDHLQRFKQLWKPGRLIVESSPGNYQVWIHSDRQLDDQEKKGWLERLGSDPKSSPKHRWGRCPGFRNRKEKYQQPDGNFPLSKLVWVDWEQRASIPVLEQETT